MSQAETKRFFGDLADNPGLKAEAENVDNGLQGLSALAMGKGYDVTVDDLKVVAAQGKDLSEAELEKVAGGFNVNMGVSVGCVACVSIS